jgi:hypothetical protein
VIQTFQSALETDFSSKEKAFFINYFGTDNVSLDDDLVHLGPLLFKIGLTVR